jgi:hypothetical protein
MGASANWHMIEIELMPVFSDSQRASVLPAAFLNSSEFISILYSSDSALNI